MKSWFIKSKVVSHFMLKCVNKTKTNHILISDANISLCLKFNQRSGNLCRLTNMLTGLCIFELNWLWPLLHFVFCPHIMSKSKTGKQTYNNKKTWHPNIAGGKLYQNLKDIYLFYKNINIFTDTSLETYWYKI